MATIEEIENIIETAARIDKMLPDRDKMRLDFQQKWPEYLYDAEDKKDQEAEEIKLKASARQIATLDMVTQWFTLLGTGKDKRTVLGKKIIWAKANGFSYRIIARAIGSISFMTCERWYKKDIKTLANKIRL